MALKDSGGTFLDEEHVVWLALPTGCGPAGGGEQGDRTTHAEPVVQGQGRRSRGQVDVAQRQADRNPRVDTAHSPRRGRGERVHEFRFEQIHGRGVVGEVGQGDNRFQAVLSNLDVAKSIQRAVDQDGAGDVDVGQSQERCLQGCSFQRSDGSVEVRDDQPEPLMVAA